MSDMGSDSARAFTIAPDRPFLQELAATLFDDAARTTLFGPGPLHKAHILVPTRRAARHLALTFLHLSEQAGREALLLPRIGTLGDLDEDVPHIAPQAGAELAALPCIEPMARHFHLLHLVRAWTARTQADDSGALNPVKLSALVFELEAFLDQAQNEQIDWTRLPDLVPDDLAENWQQTLDFLTIITQAWPAHLDEVQCLDPTERRNLLLADRAARWSTTPPEHPVIAAGSTGSIRATADLLRIIARLPRGGVVFPGLDLHADENLWRQIEKDVSHPQSAMAQTLSYIEIDRDAVRPWPSRLARDELRQKETGNTRLDRLHRAMVPADATADWAMQHKTSHKLDGLHIVETPDMQSEAGVIALLMRETLQTPDKTAALVTRDRKLARRVAAELRRWDIKVDDSAGKPLAQGAVAVWLRLILACHAEGFAPVALLALLKHPKTCMAADREAHLQQVWSLEAALLRGIRPAAGLDALLQAAQERAIDTQLIEKIIAAFQPILEISDRADMGHHSAALLATAEKLCAAGTTIWNDDEEGRALSALMEKLAAQAKLAGPIATADWPALFDMWLSRQSLRAQGPTHKRLTIWGPLEARLMQADIMILGGLNETVWPPMPETGPWLSRPMRAALGMSQPERQIGLAAHDFVQGASAANVYLTRAAKIDNAPSVAARWLRRIETLYGRQSRREQNRLLHWWRSLDKAADTQPASPPAPRPPVAARPDRLSVTQIETLLHNPYEIYARKILGLTPWEAVDADYHAGHRGTLIHTILEELVKRGLHQQPDLAHHMLALARDIEGAKPDGETILSYWKARLAAIGAWLAEHEADRAAKLSDSLVERSGHWLLDIDGEPFTLTAKADRIDKLTSGKLDIIDYKTGGVPSLKDVETHLAPQLTLEAAMVEAGAFDDLPAAPGGVNQLSYWHLTGRDPAGKALRIDANDDLIGGAVEMLHNLIVGYRDSQRAYRVHIRPKQQGPAKNAGAGSPFDHLARVKEWRADAESIDE